MKIIVIGTRGIPNIPGGVETHCEELYPRLVKLGVDVTVIRRSCYIEPNANQKTFNGVKLKTIYAPKNKSMEAIVHTFLSVIYAKKHHADLIHIHAIGPGLLVPFARFLGLTVVFTNHGPDYNRQKWGRIGKVVLELGEKFSTRYSSKIIVISNVIKQLLEEKGNRKDCCLIHNGVPATPHRTESQAYLKELKLEPHKYVLGIGRFVEEKGFHNLITVFSTLKNTEYKLVIAGDADHESSYSRKLKKQALQNGIILTGYIKENKLAEVMTNAKLFVLPSFHEGLPISLLEAMSYNLDVLVSAIPANLEVGLAPDSYFNPNNLDELKQKLENKLRSPIKSIDYDLSLYNWSNITQQTLEVYNSCYEES